MKKHWYLVAYDIASSKRLRRFHYWLSKQGIPLQKSVFVMGFGKNAAKQWLQDAEQQLSEDDDLRLYPLQHPGAVWQAGVSSLLIPTASNKR